MIKKISLVGSMLLSMVLTTACENSSPSIEPKAQLAALQAQNGTYQFENVQCYNSTLSTPTLDSSFTNGFDTLSIEGNHFTETLIAPNGGCSVLISGTLYITDQSISISYEPVVVHSNGSNCPIERTIENFAYVSPSQNSIAYVQGQTIPDISNKPYIMNDTTVQIPSVFSDSNPGDICLMAYKK